MKALLAACLLLLAASTPSAVAEEERYSPNMSWLRQTKPVMRFYIDLFEPLERANLAAAQYLTGNLNREGALYELESAKSSMDMISDNIEWSIELLPPAPEGGPTGSRQLIAQMQDLPGRLHDLDASMAQAIGLLETFVRDDDYLAYRGGVQQSIATIETVSEFITPYHEISRLAVPDWDTLSLDALAAAKLDDILSFRITTLFYSAAVLSDDHLDEETLSSLVADLDLYAKAAERVDASIASMRRQLKAQIGYADLYESDFEALSKKNDLRRRRASAYHKLVAAFSMPVPSPDLLSAAFEELQEVYEIELPVYRRAFDSAKARRQGSDDAGTLHQKEEPDPEPAGLDTPL